MSWLELQRARLVDLLVVFASLLIIVALAGLAALLYPFGIGGFFETVHLSAEKVVYLVALLVVPAAILASRPVLDRGLERLRPVVPVLRLFTVAACAAAVWAATRLDLEIFMSIPDRELMYRSTTTLTLAVIAFVAITAAYLAPRRWADRLRGGRALAFVAVTLVAMWMANYALIDTEHNYNANALNFSVVMHPVVQVVNGAGVLVDIKTQYGMYPQFLEPVFALTGGITVFRFSLVMAALLFASIASMGWFLITTVRNRALAVVGLLATLYFHYFAAFLWPYERYYQIYPLRTIVPTLTLVIGYLYLRRPSAPRFLLIVAFLSLGTLWNLDTGLFALFAFVCTAAFHAMTRQAEWPFQRILRSMFLLSVATGLLVFVAFLLYLRLRYGTWPHLSWLTAAQAFWLRGVSFPFDKLWTFVVATYIVGFVVVARRASARTAGIAESAVVLVSVLGVGLFTYHLNKGHDSTLSNSGYPALILLTMLVDRSLGTLGQLRATRAAALAADSRRMRRIGGSLGLVIDHAFAFGGLAVLCFLAGCFIVNERTSQVIQNEVTIQELWNPSRDDQKVTWPKPGANRATTDYVHVADLAAVDAPRPRPLWQLKADYMERYRLPDGDVRRDMLVLSEWDYLLYLAARGKAPSPMVNFRHLFLASDWNALFQQLEQREIPYVIVDEQQGLLKGAKLVAHVDPEMDRRLLDLLHDNYVERERSTIGDSFFEGRWYPNDIVLYERRPPEPVTN